MSRRQTHDRSLFARLTRSEAMRWLMVVLLAPLLAFGALGGGEFLAHTHDDHGLHLHDVNTLAVAAITAVDHDADHGHDHPDTREAIYEFGEFHGLGGQDDVPPGIVVSLTDDAPRPTRGIDLSGVATSSLASLVIGSPGKPPSAAPPPGVAEHGRLDLQSASTFGRLMRTSCALLL